MADAKTTGGKKGGGKKSQPKDEFVKKSDFDKLNNSVNALVDAITSGKLGAPAAKTPLEAKEDAEIKAAGPEEFDTNREWDKMAKEIIGAPVQRTEVKDLKGGGRLFTIVIKPEYSNANQDYLERYKVDRRSKEIGTEGEAGVETWCKLVRNNLKRGEKPIVNHND